MDARADAQSSMRDAEADANNGARMMVGLFASDDIFQVYTLAVSLISVALWAWVMLHSSKRLYFVPPIIATASVATFYLCILFWPADVSTETLLSAIARSVSSTNWLLLAIALILVIRRDRKV